MQLMHALLQNVQKEFHVKKRINTAFFALLSELLALTQWRYLSIIYANGHSFSDKNVELCK